MHVITAEQLKKAVPKCNNPEHWIDPINKATTLWGIAYDLEETIEFLAQAAHESQNFNRLEENLSYTAERLMEVWPTRFPTREIALTCACAPHRLADKVYGGRFGNPPNDGWTYRGRGLHMVTFKDNYAIVDRLLNANGAIVKCPEKLATNSVAAMASAAFWTANPMLRKAGQDLDTLSVTRIVNGGTIGLKERQAFVERFKDVLTPK
jgi:putative chitinase